MATKTMLLLRWTGVLAFCFFTVGGCGGEKRRLSRAFPDKDPLDASFDIPVAVRFAARSCGGGFYDLPATEYDAMMLRDEGGRYFLALMLGDPAGAEVVTRPFDFIRDSTRIPSNVVAVIPVLKMSVLRTEAVREPGVEVTGSDVTLHVARSFRGETKVYTFRLRRAKQEDTKPKKDN